jgi:hypothetical protein
LPEALIAGTGQERAKAFSPESIKGYEDSRYYRDLSVAWVIPTRGFYPAEVVDAWDMIQWPTNQFRSGRIAVKKMEVGAAYNLLVELTRDETLVRRNFGDVYAAHVLKSRWVLTTEEDNIIPPDGVQKLFTAIYACPDCGGEVSGEEWRCAAGHKGYDAVAGLYHMKQQPPVPMAYGHPDDPNDFKPRSVKEATERDEVMEVNGIPMGFTLFRKSLFDKVSKPWFQTTDANTQDIFFCKKAKDEAGARFGVHCGVKVGHLNVDTGEII